MSVVHGVDACKQGWLCLSLDLSDGEIVAEVFEHAEALFSKARAATMGIDIPIGLPEVYSRECDLAARRLLGPRSPSVFPVPVRLALNETSYEAACDVSERQCGKRLTQQTFAIVPKIREVDTALRSSGDLRERVFEVHPEVSFYFWNGKRPMQYSKRSGFGFLERLQLVEREFRDAARRIREQLRPSAVGDDDILDALAVAWTARRIHEGEAVRIPASIEEKDECGLPMQMLA